MPVVDLSNPDGPRSLVGPTCTGAGGVPRYWPTIFNNVIVKQGAKSSEKKRLRAIDRLYDTFERAFGTDCLDRLISELEFEKIEDGLMAHLSWLRMDAAIRNVDNREKWNTATGFIIEILRRSGFDGSSRADALQSKVYRLEILRQSMSPEAIKIAPARLRALPADTLEDVYEITDPYSSRNPFYWEETRFRNSALITAGMEGLRLSEQAGLRTDALQFGMGSNGQPAAWINIVHNDLRYEVRGDVPALKTESSVRQIPIRMNVAEVFLNYEHNYRGDCLHPYLFSSRERLPIGRRTIGYVFQVISNKLSPAAKKALERQGKTTVTAHDLRHTSAVATLQQLRDHGVPIEEAERKLRIKFGWKAKSAMPSHYARAYFERRLEATVNEIFDGYVDAIRRVRP